MANKKVSQLTSKPSVLTTDLFPIADPSTGQLFKTTISDLGTAIGSGVSSVNSLVGAVVLDTDDIQELVSPTNKWFTDTRARAALSASSPLTYNSGTGVFSLPQANGSTNGFLSSADWTTFNNKLSTATAASTYVPYTGATGNVNLGLDYSITAALIIKSGGTSTQFLKADGSIDTNTYLTTSSAASTYVSGSGVTDYYARFTGTKVIADGFIRTTSNITYVEGMGLSTGNGLDIQGNYGAGGGGLKIRSYDETTGNAYIDFANTGGRMYLGLNRSTSGGLMTNATAYSTVLTTGLGTSNLEFGTNATKRMTIDGTTGAVTLTSALSGTSATFTNNITLNASATNGLILQNASGGESPNVTFITPVNKYNIDANASGTLRFFTENTDGSGGAVRFSMDSVGAATFSSSVAVGTNLTVGSATGGVSAPTNILMDSTYRTGGAAFDALKLYLYKSSTETYGLGLGDLGDLQYWAGTTSTGAHRWFTSQTERMRITSSGNVVIGTTTPSNSVRFEVYDSSANGDIAMFSTAATKADIWLKDANSSAGAVRLRSESNAMVMTAGGSERMRIKSNGIINFSNVPTSSAGLSSGDVYKTVAGVLMIV